VDKANRQMLILGQYMLQIADHGRCTDMQAMIHAFNDVAETVRTLCYQVEGLDC
jgi:hypothetical protein